MSLTEKITNINCVIVSTDNILFDAKKKAFVKDPQLASAIRTFVKKNNKFIVFSNRNLIDVESTYKHLDIYDFCPYSVACNGSLIFDNVRKRKISHRYLTKNVINASEELQEKFNELKIPIALLGYDGYSCIKVCRNANISESGYREIYKSEKWTAKNDFVIVDSLKNELPLVKLVWKILPSYKGNRDEVFDIIKEHFNKLIIKPVVINDKIGNNVEINMIGNNKINAITELVDLLNIKSENCMLIGNGENDTALFDSVGISVTSANAAENKNIHAKIVLSTSANKLVTKALSMLN